MCFHVFHKIQLNYTVLILLQIIFADECTEAEGRSWHMKHFAVTNVTVRWAASATSCGTAARTAAAASRTCTPSTVIRVENT